MGLGEDVGGAGEVVGDEADRRHVSPRLRVAVCELLHRVEQGRVTGVGRELGGVLQRNAVDGGGPGVAQAAYSGGGSVGVCGDTAAGEHEQVGGAHRRVGGCGRGDVLAGGEGGYRAEGVAERFEQARDVRRDLVVGFVEFASQPAGVQVVGAGEAGELLPNPVGHPERGRAHRAGQAGPVAVDRDLGEPAQPRQRRQAHHRDVEHHAPPAGLHDEVVPPAAARRGLR